MISSINTHLRPAVIDLDGPQGNAFYILTIARSIGEVVLNDLTDTLLAEMQRGDYDHLVCTFEYYLGEYVEIVTSEAVEWNHKFHEYSIKKELNGQL